MKLRDGELGHCRGECTYRIQLCDTVRGAPSRKGSKPVTLDLGVYLRKGEKHKEESQVMESCELLLSSYFTLCKKEFTSKAQEYFE